MGRECESFRESAHGGQGTVKPHFHLGSQGVRQGQAQIPKEPLCKDWPMATPPHRPKTARLPAVPRSGRGKTKADYSLGAVLGPMNGVLKTPRPHPDRFSILPQPDCLCTRTEAKPGGDGGYLLLGGSSLSVYPKQTHPLNQTPIAPQPSHYCPHTVLDSC